MDEKPVDKNMKFEAVIGLEVHVQLSTQSKVFCGCSTRFGSGPNSQTCPVCLGLPGVLPVLNEQALMSALKVACALDCRISDFIKFDRKNYFYPDLPKNFQTSQLDKPVALNGFIEIEDSQIKKIRINRVHLEEDAGKLIHPEGDTSKDYSLIDYNRTGTPLLEIVTEPDIDSPANAHSYLSELKNLLLYLDVSDCNMEEGSLRCDANVSIRPKGQKELGVKAEVKNLNSFRAVQRSLEYEIERQTDVLEQGEKIIQETRLWNEDRQVTISMRGKEEAHDYRYFPEPDLVPFILDKGTIEEVKTSLPELPRSRRQRFIKDYSLPEHDAKVLTQERKIAEFFEKCCSNYNNYKAISNWIMGPLQAELKTRSISLLESGLKSEHLTDLIKLIDSGKINNKIAKAVFTEMFDTKKAPVLIIEEKGLGQISDEGQLKKITDKVIDDNPKSVEDYRNGKEKALKFLMGRVMAQTKGQADPVKVNELLMRRLNNEE